MAAPQDNAVVKGLLVLVVVFFAWTLLMAAAAKRQGEHTQTLQSRLSSLEVNLLTTSKAKTDMEARLNETREQVDDARKEIQNLRAALEQEQKANQLIIEELKKAKSEKTPSEGIPVK